MHLRQEGEVNALFHTFGVCFFNFYFFKLQEDYDVEIDRKQADFDAMETFKVFRAKGCCYEMCFCFTNKASKNLIKIFLIIMPRSLPP